MSATKPAPALPIAFVLVSLGILSALSALSACGGGDASASPPISASPQPVPLPMPVPAPTPTPTPPPVQITLAAGYTQISASVTFSQANWPAWTRTGSAPIDGVTCATTANYHVHALLSIYKDGQRLALPGSIGRNSSCDYEMHTHDGSGVVHIETDTRKNFTLGQFLAEWGQPISAGTIAGLAGTPAFYIIENEKIAPFSGDPATIELTPHREVLVVVGTPPSQVPRYDWGHSGL